MGSVSQPSKNEVVKKIKMGLGQVLKNNNSALMAISRFKEVKHHLIDLTVDDREDMDSFEDNGASLIETDFTWVSNAFDIYRDPHLEALHYAWNQTPEGQKYKLDWVEALIENHDLNGFVFPDKTPDGIDLCIYFYGGDDKDGRTEKDLDLLWILNKLGVLILPVISISSLKKEHLASLLNQRNIKCMDLTGIEMERPSFGNYNRTRRVDDTIPQLQPFEILDIDQLVRIQNTAIYELLKKSRFRMATRTALKNIFESNHDIKPSVKTHSGSLYKRYGTYIATIVAMAVAMYTIACFILQSQSSSSSLASQPHWIASFDMDPDQHFYLSLENKRNHVLDWPINDPQVWIKSKDKATIKRVYGDPGTYKVILPMNYDTLFFTINSSVEVDHYLLAENKTFIWLNKPSISTTSSTTTIALNPTSDHYIGAMFQHPVLLFKAMLYGDDKP
jgi:hypothetical protein